MHEAARFSAIGYGAASKEPVTTHLINEGGCAALVPSTLEKHAKDTTACAPAQRDRLKDVPRHSITISTLSDRQLKVQRYLEKKRRGAFKPHVKYENRRTSASKRVRLQGRFVKEVPEESLNVRSSQDLGTGSSKDQGTLSVSQPAAEAVSLSITFKESMFQRNPTVSATATAVPKVTRVVQKSYIPAPLECSSSAMLRTSSPECLRHKVEQLQQQDTDMNGIVQDAEGSSHNDYLIKDMQGHTTILQTSSTALRKKTTAAQDYQLSQALQIQGAALLSSSPLAAAWPLPQSQACIDADGCRGSALKHAQRLLALITAGALASYPSFRTSEISNGMNLSVAPAPFKGGGAEQQVDTKALELGVSPCRLRIEPLSLTLPT
ncbi:hypothetical protein CEUSTIGMA_g5390.t1 [Chlamydomonas eustigma]|uniref:CCT domain-containing protein n=1 Tax=Chlamydomonas eustigma TaxID=1157962 RepID=A0A250X4D6_9CHLO|nr:hypothetical protein CEUSTIGMA_g5390.t1 [Chlamydomonas eustigma]|eukprot:GAX77948.1 hypothetical protein CEUSTIGMA_g5390.t1 [Chlamydomonas eustigma]